MSVKQIIFLGWAVTAAGYLAWRWWDWTGDPNQYGPYYLLLWLPLVGTLIATLVVLWRMRGINDGQQ